MALGDRFRSWFRFRTADIAPAIFIFIVLLAGILLVSFSKPSSTSHKKEAIRSWQGDSVKETIDTIRLLSQSQKGIDSRTRETSKDYVGPSSHSDYQPKRRLPEGATIDLNLSDSATLTLVPGIGPAFARRIVSLRNRLGGYYTILQLQEVYGMTPDRYRDIKKYFTLSKVPQRINLSQVAYDSIPRHPYLSREQTNALQRILFRDGKLRGWQQLLALDCFTRDDSIRLSHYFIVENSLNKTSNDHQIVSR